LIGEFWWMILCEKVKYVFNKREEKKKKLFEKRLIGVEDEVKEWELCEILKIRT